eukprot:1141786-Pelagomonas_calceolata.AAC.4
MGHLLQPPSRSGVKTPASHRGLESASARPSQIWLHYPGSAVCQSCGAVWGDHAVDKKEVDTEQVGFKYKH